MPVTSGPGGRRGELLRAARVVTAREGLRGLTHRAADREAGLPLGTCSAYLRTSLALRTALAQDVAAELTADVERLAEDLGGPLGPVPPRAEALRLTSGLFARWLRERTAYVVSLELGLAATRDADLAVLLGGWRERLVEVVEALVRRRGPAPRGVATAEVAQMLVAACDGALSAALLRPEPERAAVLTTWLGLLLDAVVPDTGEGGSAAPALD